MWVENGFPPETFWKQTQRSFSNALIGAARRNTSDAWLIGVMSGLGFSGKIKPLNEYLRAEQSDVERLHNAKLYNYFAKLSHRGIPMTIEKIERLN